VGIRARNAAARAGAKTSRQNLAEVNAQAV